MLYGSTLERDNEFESVIICAKNRKKGVFTYVNVNVNLEMLVFDERGKSEYPVKNLSEQAREPTTNSTTYNAGSHWWEASALTTVPSLLPSLTLDY